jgi:hypothetical protein
MTGLELVAGYLIAWGVRKLKRAGKRLDEETDEVIDAGLDRLHDAIAGKLGTDPALVKLDADVSQGTEPSDRTLRRVQDTVEEAAEHDPLRRPRPGAAGPAGTRTQRRTDGRRDRPARRQRRPGRQPQHPDQHLPLNPVAPGGHPFR